ncbi:MAG: hypothetical protein U0361_18595 [Nitrospiraceae bacterium]
MLLSSLTGAAVTTVKIEGVLHEFSTIPGVTEDVTSIVSYERKNAVLAAALRGDGQRPFA